VLAVAACAAPPRIAATPEAQSVAPPDQIDGRYRGIARLTRADIRNCPRSGNRIITVEGSSLSVPYRGASASYSLAASVAANGSIHGSDGRGTIDGQISGQHMDLTVSSEFCELRYALERM
jgi:hypothetical protein